MSQLGVSGSRHALRAHATRLFAGDQAITAMVIAERRAAACHGDNPFTSGWREELDV